MNVLIVEDDAGYRALLQRRVSKLADTVGAVGDGEDALVYIDQQDVDVMFCDVVMPGIAGPSLVKIVRRTRPQMDIIMLSGQGTVEQAVELMKLGVVDYLVKPASEQQLADVLDRCRKREEGRLRRGPEARHAAERFDLTRQEERIMAMVLSGRTNQQIADALAISLHTVKKHVQHIFRKTGSRDRVELLSRFPR